MSHGFTFWAVIIAAILAFTIMFAALGWLYLNSKKQRGEK